MFLHIGSDVVVPLREVIAILDAALLERSQAVRDLISLQQAERRGGGGGGGRPRPAAFTDRGEVLSPLSPLNPGPRGGLLRGTRGPRHGRGAGHG
ncbi:MAG: hypothetical protein DIU69_06040, partial [Bacillota bacterium]